MNKAVGYMLISVLGFSLMNLCVKFLDRLPATELVLFRSIVSLVLCLIFLKRKKISVWGNNKKWLIRRGVFGVIALTSFFYTLQNLGLGSAITLQYLSPIFTSIFGIFILKERVRHIQWLFFLISFIGIAIIKGFDLDISMGLFLLSIASSAFAGLAYNSIGKLRTTDHPIVIVFYFPLIALPIMSIFSFFNWVQPIGYEWALLLGIGILTQIAQVNMTKAMHSGEMNEITGLKYLGIIFAIGFDLILFDIHYEIQVFIGMALVLSGVILNLLYKSRLRRKALN